MLDNIAQTIRAHKFNHVTEDDLQRGIAEVLRSQERNFVREAVLSPKDRIDFLVEEKVGIEAKDDGSLTLLTRQIHRYLQFDRVESLIVVTTRAQHQRLPSIVSGKMVRVCYLNPLL